MVAERKTYLTAEEPRPTRPREFKILIFQKGQIPQTTEYPGPYKVEAEDGYVKWIPLTEVTDFPKSLSEYQERFEKETFDLPSWTSILTEDNLKKLGRSLDLESEVIRRNQELLKNLYARFQTSAIDWKAANGVYVPLILSLGAEFKNEPSIQGVITKTTLPKVGKTSLVFVHEQSQTVGGKEVVISTGSDVLKMASFGKLVSTQPQQPEELEDFSNWTKCSKRVHYTTQEDVSACTGVCGDENLVHKPKKIVEMIDPEYFDKKCPFDDPIAYGYIGLIRALIEGLDKAREKSEKRDTDLEISKYSAERLKAPIVIERTGTVTYIKKNDEHEDTYDFAVVEQKDIEQNSGKTLIAGNFAVRG